jgi:hypothetical protein
MEMEKIKWDEGMAERCIARHKAYLRRVSRSAGAEQDAGSADSAAEAEEDDDCWAEFSERIKRLTAK